MLGVVGIASHINVLFRVDIPDTHLGMLFLELTKADLFLRMSPLLRNVLKPFADVDEANMLIDHRLVVLGGRFLDLSATEEVTGSLDLLAFVLFIDFEGTAFENSALYSDVVFDVV